MSNTVWVSLAYATFGIDVLNGKVVRSAPIGHWMVGKDFDFITSWIESKGGEWKILD